MQAEALAQQVVLMIKSALTPILERVSATEAKLSTLGDVRDRVVTLETKQAIPTPPDPSIAEVRERLSALETKFGAFQTKAHGEDVSRVDITAMSLRLDKLASDIAAVREALPPDVSAALAEKTAALSERIAVLETRAPIPGPMGEGGRDGKDGAPGKDGLNGKDGKDGLDGVGFDDLMVEQQGDRSIAIKAARGDKVKVIGTLTMPVQIYRGVFINGKAYEHGDVVTWGGSQWHCNEPTTTKPDDGTKAWTLVVKRGRDGKDGKDAPGALPVVSLGRPQ